MIVTVNGEERDIEEGITLKKLINELGIKDKVMAAAVNMEIVKEDKWSKYVLKEKDRVELLHFVGGG